MGSKKKKRRQHQPSTQPKRMEQLAADILAGTISGLITAAILRMLDWSRPRVQGIGPLHPKI